MATLVAGRLAELIVLVSAFLGVLVLFHFTRRGWKSYIRRLPIMDGIDQAVGRAAEMGRSVFYSTALGLLSKTEASQTLASLGVLGYVAKQTANYDVPLIVGVCVPETIPAVDDVVRSAYTEVGKPEKYIKDEVIRFLSPDQWGFCSAVMGMLRRNPTGGTIIIGEVRGDALMYFESGADRGSIQIGGTATMSNIQFIAMSTDYFAIGEEVFASAAYATGDPMLTNTLFEEDVVKFGWIAYLVAGILLAAAGSPLLLNILKL